MSNPTNPFSWQMPTPTDLVTDLPADFEVFGQAVATSLADLLGGTSGQILAKNSNTDMDFVWIANDQGDITGITASSPLTGGGTSGAVTIGIQDGTTAQKGAVQLENSTSSTSTTTAAVPASVKSAYDLANAAIPKSLVDAAGDLIYATADDTPARLALGTAGQVLTVNSGATAPEWKAGGATFAGCSLKKSASQSVADNTVTAMTWDQEVFDTDGYHSTVTNTDRITIPAGKGGYYLVTCVLYFNDTDADTWRDIRIYKNGTNTMATRVPGSNQSAKAPVISDIFALASGDYIQAYAVQASGASVDVYSAGDQVQTRFAVAYLGA
jgi:hypothetical protein